MRNNKEEQRLAYFKGVWPLKYHELLLETAVYLSKPLKKL